MILCARSLIYSVITWCRARSTKVKARFYLDEASTGCRMSVSVSRTGKIHHGSASNIRAGRSRVRANYGLPRPKVSRYAVSSGQFVRRTHYVPYSRWK